jgi:hypothetical protein
VSEIPGLIGPPVGYTDMLDISIHDHLRSGARSKYFPLRPSSAGACARKLAYDLMAFHGYAEYPTEHMTPEVYRLLELGSSVEFSLLKVLRTVAPHVEQKYKQQVVELFRLEPVTGEAMGRLIEGSIDAALVSEKWKCVMDVKSFKDGFSAAYQTRMDETLAKFGKMASLAQISDTAYWAANLDALVEELRGDFLTDNLKQVNCYLCSDFMKSRGFNHGVVWKYNKNDSRHYEIRFAPSQTQFDAVRDKFNRVNQAVAKKDPDAVKRDAVLGSMRCAFCPYQKECWQEDAKKAWFRTFPPKKWPIDVAKLRLKPAEKAALEKAFAQFEAAGEAADAAAHAESAIIGTLAELEIAKVRLASGAVYEVKHLKSPRPHFELRRSKS